jgi:hypothetical protein
MEDLKAILQGFSCLRDRCLDIEKAIDQVSNDLGIDREEVLDVLTTTGVFVMPNSKAEDDIKDFIRMADRAKTTANELAKEVGFRFCISNKEAERLVLTCFD